jgi:hypothetical protein
VSESSLSVKSIFKTWWPLAASWLLMGVELPLLSAVVARLANPEVNLAAYGGVVFPLALLVESPIIMLLAASTALSKDWDSYQKIRRFMRLTAGSLTALHVLVAFTPVYYFVVNVIIGAPQEIVEPARTGLMILTPWTFSIAYRRFNQGVLIRFNHSKAVGLGTAVRLTTDVTVLGIGYLLGSIPGIVVAASAVAAGVISEAVYAGIVVQPVLRRELKLAPPVEEPISLPSFLSFYIPLAMTSLLTLLAQPIGSAALSRMPLALESLAVWPVVSGLIFMFRSLGLAYNEVVVALLDLPGSHASLRRFAGILAFGITAVMLLIVATPLSHIWFREISALNPELAQLAQRGVWLAVPIPAIAVLQSWYQGAIVNGRRTRGVTEAVVVFLVTIGGLLGAGVLWGAVTGLLVGVGALMASMTVQTVWLWVRSRPVMRSRRERDEALLPSEAAAVSTN